MMKRIHAFISAPVLMNNKYLCIENRAAIRLIYSFVLFLLLLKWHRDEVKLNEN